MEILSAGISHKNVDRKGQEGLWGFLLKILKGFFSEKNPRNLQKGEWKSGNEGIRRSLLKRWLEMLFDKLFFIWKNLSRDWPLKLKIRVINLKHKKDKENPSLISTDNIDELKEPFFQQKENYRGVSDSVQLPWLLFQWISCKIVRMALLLMFMTSLFVWWLNFSKELIQQKFSGS